MIHGIGVDIIELSRIERAMKRNARFVERILTTQERAALQTMSDSRKIEYVAGRFAAKEAFVKASGIKEVSWMDVEILNASTGKPTMTEFAFMKSFTYPFHIVKHMRLHR